MEFEHLLLGDLHELLNDPTGRERDRWLLATLDMLLVARPRPGVGVYLPFLPREQNLLAGGSRPAELPIMAELPVPFEKLQRLRDRIAHRAPYELLAQELVADLRVHFEISRQALESVLPQG